MYYLRLGSFDSLGLLAIFIVYIFTNLDCVTIGIECRQRKMYIEAEFQSVARCRPTLKDNNWVRLKLCGTVCVMLSSVLQQKT